MATKQPQRPPSTTYSHRKPRLRQSRASSSSPLKAPEKDDVTMQEMWRRMKKRARQPTAPVALDSLEVEHNSKRHKQDSDVTADLDSITLPNLSRDYIIPITSRNDSLFDQFKTPANAPPSPHVSRSRSRRSVLPEQFSPMPVSRHKLARTSSRKLKENSNILDGLASPFHSRPGSKTSSPGKKKLRKNLHAKSRTLSDSRPADHSSTVQSRTQASSVRVGKPAHHARCPSGPDASTAYLLDQISDDDWFRPARALTQGPFLADAMPPGTPQLDWSFSTESFYRDFPLRTSTPVSKKKAFRLAFDEGTPSAPNTPEMRDRHAGEDVVMADVNTSPEQPPRRTYIHYSKNSIFSSSFVDSTTALLSHQRSKSYEDSLSSMSLTDTVVSRSVPGSHLGHFDMADDIAPEVVATPCSSPIAEELSGMLVSMGFVGTFDRMMLIVPFLYPPCTCPHAPICVCHRTPVCSHERRTHPRPPAVQINILSFPELPESQPYPLQTHPRRRPRTARSTGLAR